MTIAPNLDKLLVELKDALEQINNTLKNEVPKELRKCVSKTNDLSQIIGELNDLFRESQS